ncbi:hypothetical protein HDU96_005511 [Phlyctochytrium bullatum]|nr:hypothetical protein HDU96_005511 [Phlyctochytrium bullatum]
MDYLAKYLAPAPSMLPGDMDKRKRKKKKLKTVVVSHSTKIIDEGEDWIGNRRFDEDDEMKPVIVDMVPMEDRFKSDSWAVVQEGSSSNKRNGEGERRRTPSPSPSPRPTRRTPTPSPPPEERGAQKRKDMLSSGIGAGLQTGEQVRADLERKKEAEMARLRQMDPALSGRNAQTVFRDKFGRKLDMEDERAKELEKQEQRRIDEEERLQFREGLAQKRMKEQMRERLSKEKSSSFAVYADDAERNEQLKEKDRWGDPLAFMGGSSSKKKSGRKRYQGPPPPPNRYGIEPGYRWDGVDRGNGFEMKLIQAKYARQTRAEEAHKWSTEDM